MLLLLTHDFLEISKRWEDKTIEKQAWLCFPVISVPVHNDLFKQEPVRLKVAVIT